METSEKYISFWMISYLNYENHSNRKGGLTLKRTLKISVQPPISLDTSQNWKYSSSQTELSISE